MIIPARPLLRWHGGKWRLAGWLIGQFPPDGVYGEPFAGTASVPARRAGNVALFDGHPCLRYADLYPHWRRLERRVFADARAWRTEITVAQSGRRPQPQTVLALEAPRMIAKARIAATLALQRPEPPRPMPRDVCPHCQRETTIHGFTAPDGHWLETHHCAEHGDVAPMRGPITNEE